MPAEPAQSADLRGWTYGPPRGRRTMSRRFGQKMSKRANRILHRSADSVQTPRASGAASATGRVCHTRILRWGNEGDMRILHASPRC